MKTSVNMLRKIGDFEMTQRTKDGYFDANTLLRKWNKNKDNPERAMSRFIDSPKTKEFILELSQNANLQGGIIQQVKGRNTKKGKTLDKTWMHPYLFIDFAMWLNPKFKLKVIEFVYDQLIEFRHNAGDMYKGLSNALVKFKDVSFVQVAKGLNWIVFDKHEKGIRQKATQKQLKELTDLQKKLAFAIDMEYIKNYDQFINELRKLYSIKNDKF